MSTTPQVDKTHYEGDAYRSVDRWVSYFHQIGLITRTGATSVLEVGVGSGVLARELRARGLQVQTLDIAEDLSPDLVGSITDIPLTDGSVAVTAAFEVLEHIPFTDVPQALGELTRVARTHVAVSLPHPGWVFSIIYKLPLLPRLEVFFQIPFFWKTHIFNGEHYWELGKRGYSVSNFLACARDAKLELVAFEKYADDPAHRFFLFKKL